MSAVAPNPYSLHPARQQHRFPRPFDTTALSNPPPQVYGLYAVLFLSALNRLPIKLPAKGTGRKHRGGGGARGGPGGGEGARRGAGGGSVLFADVAGVDEAKEELQEIVVRTGNYLLVRMLWYVYESHGQRLAFCCGPCCGWCCRSIVAAAFAGGGSAALLGRRR